MGKRSRRWWQLGKLGKRDHAHVSAEPVLKMDSCYLSKMARTKQTARKQPMPGMSMRQIEVSTSEEGEEPMAKKKPKTKAKKREADSSGIAPEAAELPAEKKKKSAKRKKEETATPGTLVQKKALSTKKELLKGAKKKAAPQGTRGKPKRSDTFGLCTGVMRNPLRRFLHPGTGRGRCHTYRILHRQ